jgi:hypothetical protein
MSDQGLGAASASVGETYSVPPTDAAMGQLWPSRPLYSAPA